MWGREGVDPLILNSKLYEDEWQVSRSGRLDSGEIILITPLIIG
jgi:hypothetical protein